MADSILLVLIGTIIVSIIQVQVAEASQGDRAREEQGPGLNPLLPGPRARTPTLSHSSSLTSPEALVKNEGSPTSPLDILLSNFERRSQYKQYRWF